MSQSNTRILMRLRHSALLALLLGSASASCAHPAPGPTAVHKPMVDPTAQAQPPMPASEVRTVEVILREDRIEAVARVPAGALTFSFSNATRRERTAEIEGKGGPRRIERPIPPDRSMTLEVMLEPGDYVLVSRAGGTSITAKFRAIKPGSTP